MYTFTEKHVCFHVYMYMKAQKHACFHVLLQLVLIFDPHWKRVHYIATYTQIDMATHSNGTK